VVSTARLGQDPEAQANPRIVVDRTITETIHELGHSFGLLHCDTPGCVMTRSVALADVTTSGPRCVKDAMACMPNSAEGRTP